MGFRRHHIAFAVSVAVTHSLSAQGGSAGVPVRGIVFDAIRGKPLGNAAITLVGGGRNARSDSRGRFQFDSVAPGTYTFTAQHSLLDSLGLSGLSTRAVVTNGREEVRLSVPSFATLWRAACGSGRVPADSGFVYGTLRDAATDQPVANARVDVSWTELMVDRKRGMIERRWRIETTSDSRGSYSVCGVSPHGWLRVQALSDTSASGGIDLVPVELRVRRRDLLMGSTRQRDTSRRGTVVGFVRDSAGLAFADVRVALDSATQQRSDGNGRFVFRNVPLGTRQIEITSLGVTPVAMVVDVTYGDTVLAFAVLRRPVLMEAVHRVAGRVGPVLAKEFDERRKSAGGFSMDSTAIARFRTVDNALRSAPSTSVAVQKGTLQVTMPDGRGGNCIPEVRIDAVPAGLGHIIDLHTNEVAAIEVFARALSVPSRFTNGEPARCGMILIWTKYGFRLR